MERVAIIGAGSWGTALSIAAAQDHPQRRVRVWARSATVIEDINERHVNSRYLPQAVLPSNVCATEQLSEAVEDAELVILAAPSHALRSLLTELQAAMPPAAIYVSATKGIESETGLRVSEIVAEVLGDEARRRFVCLTGPSFAREVVLGQPTAMVAASDNAEDVKLVQVNLSTPYLRIYTNADVTGAEIGGAVKNVIAIAAGMVAGLGLGANSVAALITRGLAEITRFALAQGARAETMMGLAGLGDLVLTCTGELSRNRYVGYEMGRGRLLTEIIAQMSEVAEGVKTTCAVRLLADRLKVEMPIASVVYQVLYENKSAREAADELMMRPLRAEF